MVSRADVEEEFDLGEGEPALRDVLPPVPKARINPKMGLAAMVYFTMDLRLRATMSDGRDAEEAWLCLTPADLEKLEDIADTLEWFRLQRAMQKAKPAGRRSWS